jgi:hypothetical protein
VRQRIQEEIGVRALIPGAEHGAGNDFFIALAQSFGRVDAIALFAVLTQLPLPTIFVISISIPTTKKSSRTKSEPNFP